MSQEDWPARLARIVATEVKRYRRERGLTAQQLADRCAELGVAFPRAVLANFESGRRPTVSIAELLVLAAALDVPPMLLLVPLGRVDMVEILPGRLLPPRRALGWLDGEESFDLEANEARGLDWMDRRSTRLLYDRHAELEDELLESSLWEGIRTLDEGGSPRVAMSGREMRRRFEGDLRAVRRRMGELELIPPELPEELAYLDQLVSDGGE